MNKEEFKRKYFTNNFYWVTKNNYLKLQEIGIEVGCLCHTFYATCIKWHEGFVNLGFLTYEKNNNVIVFQKDPFLMEGESATRYEDMLADYQKMNKSENGVKNE